MKRYILSKPKGFTLIGVILAAGMTGSLSLLLAQMSKQQMITQKKAETGSEVIQTTNRISRILQDNVACVNTLRGGSGSVTITNGVAFGLTSLRDKNNTPFMSTGMRYSNGLIELSNIMVNNISLNSNVGKLDVMVTLRKTSSAIKGQKEVIKSFSLAVEVDASNRLLRCRSHIEAAIAAAKKNLCSELGGAYDASALSCTSALANKRCPTGEYIVGFEDDMNLKCQQFANSGPSIKHPTGNNCFIQATYNNTGEINSLSSTNSWINNFLGSSAERIWKWRLRGPPCTTWFCRGQMSGCPTGFQSKFRRISISSGNRFDLMLHYCCE